MGISQENINSFLQKEATKDELLHLRGIIYLIFNTKNNKGYVGRTIDTFHERYSGGKWWVNRKGRPANSLLEKATKKYGKEQFKIFILESNILSKRDNTEREVYWAKLLDTYAPNGYNIRECGEGREFYNENGKVKTKQYKLIDKDNHEYNIEDLPQFCRERNLHYSSLRDLSAGRLKSSQGFTVPNSNFHKKPEEILNRDKIISLLDTNGKEYIIRYKEIDIFCLEHNLLPRGIKLLLNDTTAKTHRGWKLKGTTIGKYKNIVLIKHDKKIEGKSVRELMNYIKIENPNSSEISIKASINTILRGVCKSAYGYEVEKIEFN